MTILVQMPFTGREVCQWMSKGFFFFVCVVKTYLLYSSVINGGSGSEGCVSYLTPSPPLCVEFLFTPHTSGVGENDNSAVSPA